MPNDAGSSTPTGSSWNLDSIAIGHQLIGPATDDLWRPDDPEWRRQWRLSDDEIPIRGIRGHWYTFFRKTDGSICQVDLTTGEELPENVIVIHV